MTATAPISGSCLCGAVAFELAPPLRDVVACHCSQCRKQSGHYWAATAVPKSCFRLTHNTGLKWFSASAAARRGFCAYCGSFLFWEPSSDDRISLSAGALDDPTGLRLIAHIHKNAAADYYSPEGPPPEPATTAPPERLAASCLCGANRFSLPGPATEIDACHCTQCRKLSGHYTASLGTDEAAMDWSARLLHEFRLPGGAIETHCRDCGCRLYFRSHDRKTFAVAAGLIDGPTGARLTKHIFTAWQGDYYVINDGLPQFPARD